MIQKNDGRHQPGTLRRPTTNESNGHTNLTTCPPTSHRRNSKARTFLRIPLRVCAYYGRDFRSPTWGLVITPDAQFVEICAHCVRRIVHSAPAPKREFARKILAQVASQGKGAA